MEREVRTRRGGSRIASVQTWRLLLVLLIGLTMGALSLLVNLAASALTLLRFRLADTLIQATGGRLAPALPAGPPRVQRTASGERGCARRARGAAPRVRGAGRSLRRGRRRGGHLRRAAGGGVGAGGDEVRRRRCKPRRAEQLPALGGQRCQCAAAQGLLQRRARQRAADAPDHGRQAGQRRLCAVRGPGGGGCGPTRPPRRAARRPPRKGGASGSRAQASPRSCTWAASWAAPWPAWGSGAPAMRAAMRLARWRRALQRGRPRRSVAQATKGRWQAELPRRFGGWFRDEAVRAARPCCARRTPCGVEPSACVRARRSTAT